MKKLLLYLLIAVMLMGIAACSPSASPTPTSAITASPTSAAATTAAATADPAQPTEPGRGEKDENGVYYQGLPVVDEPIYLEGMVNKPDSHPDWNSHMVVKELEARTNVIINWECLSPATYNEQRNLRLASMDLPDIMIRAGFNNASVLMEAATNEQVIRLNELLETYGPNFSAIAAEYPKMVKGISMPDGAIYALPQLNLTLGSLASKQFINKTWLDALNLGLPKTVDDLYNVLVAFRDNDPNGNGKKDEIPFSGYGSADPGGLLTFFYGAWGYAYNTSANKIAGFVDTDDEGKVRMLPTDPGYYALVEFVAKLWSEKLIDPELFTLNQAQFVAKVSEDLIGLQVNVNNQLEYMGESRKNFVTYEPLIGPAGTQKHVQVNGFLQTPGCFVITTACEHPEAVMRWIDYWYSEEGTLLIRMGIEGIGYNLGTDENGETIYIATEENETLIRNNDYSMTLYGGGGYPQFIVDKVDASTPVKDPDMKIALSIVEPFLVDQNKIPSLTFTEDETDVLKRYQTEMNSYINESLTKFITGETALNDANWSAFQEQLNVMGLSDYLAVLQSAYDRWAED